MTYAGAIRRTCRRAYRRTDGSGVPCTVGQHPGPEQQKARQHEEDRDADLQPRINLAEKPSSRWPVSESGAGRRRSAGRPVRAARSARPTRFVACTIGHRRIACRTHQFPSVRTTAESIRGNHARGQRRGQPASTSRCASTVARPAPMVLIDRCEAPACAEAPISCSAASSSPRQVRSTFHADRGRVTARLPRAAPESTSRAWSRPGAGRHHGEPAVGQRVPPADSPHPMPNRSIPG